MDNILKTSDKIQRYAGCKVGDKVTLKKSIKEIKAHTEVKILDIRCNDRQRIYDTDLRGHQVEVSLNTFEYKIGNELWVTHDKLDIGVKSYKPRIKTCVAEIVAIVLLSLSGLNLFIMNIFYDLPSVSKVVACVSCYLALAVYMSLHENKLKTDGTDLKLIKVKGTERKKLK